MGLLTEDLSLRIERALSLAAQSRLSHVQELPGNPLGIEMRHWDCVSANLVRRDVLYYRHFNSVREVRRGDEVHVDGALTWFRSQDKACTVHLCPEANEVLRDHLEQGGLRQSWLMAVMCATPVAIEPRPTAVHVQASRGPSESFLTLWLDGTPPEERDFLRRVALAEFADWHCYVAFVEARPVAFAALYPCDAIGVMASAWTAPEFRGRGCQTALLRERINHTAEAGMDLVVSHAAAGSASQRNMERLGLQVAYTEAIWAISDPNPSAIS